MIKMFYDIYRMTQDQVLAKYSQQPKSSLQFYGLQSKNDFYILEVVLNMKRKNIQQRCMLTCKTSSGHCLVLGGGLSFSRPSADELPLYFSTR